MMNELVGAVDEGFTKLPIDTIMLVKLTELE